MIAGSVLDALAIGSAGFSEVTAVDGALGSLDELLAALEAKPRLAGDLGHRTPH
ncbi:MAG: hypothetical protein IPG04_40185 [Polyangiaceae bacterium]|nr:hypothetical protein [Polyangiaceae bacterium]